MPNIIEQQDLLKGLPDARLAMLLQNPMGDIPPFLVAAEAQRRQAIRQQFASESPKESVVDTLTKQIANVPQNVNATSRTPPNVPPTPPMQGVMALQQQQAMAGIAQQAQRPQQMRGGGMVQRYQGAGLVQPVGNRVQEIADQFNVTVEEAAQMMRNNPSLAAPQIESDLGKPFYVPESNAEAPAEETRFFGYTIGDIGKMASGLGLAPFARGLGLDPASVAQSREELDRAATERKNSTDAYRQAYESGYRGIGQMPTAATATPPPKPKPRPDDLVKPQAGETEDEFRARIEALMAAQEPSDWEKAQRWFAMSEQFLDPSKTTMQSVAGAGRAFAEQSAAMSAAERDANLAREKALLEYDMGIAAEKRAIEAERAKREYESELKREERGVLGAKDAMGYFGTEIKALYDQMEAIDENMMIPQAEKDAAKKSIREQIDAYRLQAAALMKSSGYNAGNVVTLDELRALAGQ
jgi:hypothetical protein